VVTTPFDIGILAYPWDVDPEEARALADAGVTSFSIAAAYHSVRELRPRSRERPVLTRDAGLHWKPGADAFRGAAIAPIVDPAPSFETALRSVGEARVWAWCAVLHSSPLAAANPKFALRDAWGQPSRHALCPSRTEVQDYASRMLADLTGRIGVPGVELEAAGFHGWRHASLHDKSAVEVGVAANLLLSLCLCSGCCAAYERSGIDSTELAKRVREAAHAALAHPDATADAAAFLASWIGEELLARTLAVRGEIVRDFTAVLRGAIPASTPVLVHAGADPLTTGSRAVLPPEALSAVGGVDGVVVSTDAADRARYRQIVERSVIDYPDRSWVSLRVMGPEVSSGRDLAERTALARVSRARGVRLHNWGLWNETQMSWVTDAAAR